MLRAASLPPFVIGAATFLVAIGVFSGETQRWVTFAFAAAIVATSIAAQVVNELIGDALHRYARHQRLVLAHTNRPCCGRSPDRGRAVAEEEPVFLRRSADVPVEGRPNGGPGRRVR
jgi:hypothetical protein